jgi:dipeptidyl aminopeptidase/acylaminoacyl peptidase
MKRLIFLMVFISCVSHADRLPVEAFGALPAAYQVKLSPDGQKIAYKGNIQGKAFIASYNLKTGKKEYLVHTDNQKFKLGWFRWANNKIILVSAHYPNQDRTVKYGESRLLKVRADGSSPAEPVVKLRRKDLITQFQSSVVDFLPDDPDYILMQLRLEHRSFPSLYKINISDSKAKRKRIKGWRFGTQWWMTDRQHRLRLGSGVDDTKGFYRLLDLQTNKWRRIWEYESFEEPGILPLGFAADPNQLYVRADHKGRYAIFKVDLSDPDLSKELVYSDPNYDIEGSLIYSRKTNDVVGVFHSEAEGSKVFFDAKFQAFQRGLDKAIPDAYNQVVSFSADERKYILFSSNTKEPGAYYLGDRDAKSLDYILEQYPLLYEQPLSGKEKITYQARDKLKIEAYLTMPHGGIVEDNPAIILPHGGPMTRHYDGFDWFVEFFASRGYVVLQPNFRGSSGYGFEFEMKSIGDWGGAMQDDLADAATWLIANHSVDSQSICILGGSYGGYAALMAAAKQQHIFKCAASLAGVSDLNLRLRKKSKFSNYDIVKKQVGDDRKKLKQRSPITYVKNINIPVMIIHGDQDTRVSVEQSRNMYKALQKHNKQVEYIELKEGDHAMSNEANRLLVLTSFERFLNQHIPVLSDRFN